MRRKESGVQGRERKAVKQGGGRKAVKQGRERRAVCGEKRAVKRRRESSEAGGDAEEN